MDKVDIKVLAEQLGISPSTVSRSLRDSHEISEETKQRVKALATKLNYEPHPYASGLRKHKSKTIAVVVPDVANNFFSRVFSGIESIAIANNYHVLIYLTHESYEKEVNFIRHLLNGRVDGVILSIASNTKNFEHIIALKDLGIPFIFFDRVYNEIDTTKITTNDFEISFAATELLAKRGCKRVAHLTTSLHLTTTQKRRDGYLAACKKFQLPIDENLIIEETGDEMDTESKLKALLTSSQPPDGIFAAVEKLSLLPYKVCKDLNIPIPAKLKVIAFANSEAAAFFQPALTTIIQPAYEIGREATIVLMNHLEKKKNPILNTTIILPSTIVERESTQQ
jgi:LacI family transcriptional regulator